MSHQYVIINRKKRYELWIINGDTSWWFATFESYPDAQVMKKILISGIEEWLED